MLDPKFRVDPRHTLEVITSPEFRQYRAKLDEWQRRARALRGDSVAILELQAEMCSAVMAFQEARRDLTGGSQPADVDVDATVRLNRALEYCVRQIADGIAWRELGYDRAVLHHLANRQDSGHLEKNTVLSEITEAAHFTAESGELSLINDLTNFLRYGDFTSVRGKRLQIHEVKSGKASARDRRSARQRHATSKVIDFLNAGEMQTDGGTHRISRISAIPVSHAAEVGNLITTANRHGSAYERLTKALAIEAFHEDFFDRQAHLTLRNPFRQSRYSSVESSIDIFGRFTKNVAPFTVFPISSEQCISLLTGRVVVFAYFNEDNLFKAVRRRGVSIERPPKAMLVAAPRDALPGQIPALELRYGVRVWNDRLSMTISPAWYSRVPREFLDEESVADALEEELSRDTSSYETAYVAFDREDLIWD